MFEQIVRPFETRPVITTRRIVPAVSQPTETETAVLSWGAAGTLPQSVQQADGTNLENIESVGFRLRQCSENWTQNGAPETEEVDVPVRNAAGAEIGQTTVNRIRKINFRRRETAPEPFSYAAVGVSEVVAGLRRDIPGSSSCDASYRFNYN